MRYLKALLLIIPACCGLAVVGAAISYALRPIQAAAPPALVTTQRPAQPKAMPIQLPTATLPAASTPVPPSPIPATTKTPTRPATIQAAASATRSPATTAPTWTPRPNVVVLPTSTTGSSSALAAECPCDRGNALNCPDFTSQSQAQICYIKCGGLGSDIHDLDRNEDGTACEDTPY